MGNLNRSNICSTRICRHQMSATFVSTCSVRFGVGLVHRLLFIQSSARRRFCQQARTTMVQTTKMTPVEGLPFMDAEVSAALDRRLMSPEIGYKLEQLMELAGQACALGVDSLYPQGDIEIAVGPGNNGGDGLVTARHLSMLGRRVKVIVPGPALGKFPYLELQCAAHGVPLVDKLTEADVVVDSIFGFSFTPRGEKGVSGAFAELICDMNESGKTIVSIDVPSGWNVDMGDVNPELICVRNPAAVISLSAPKLCMKAPHEEGKMTHLIGGRFVPDVIWKEFELQPVVYEGTELFRRVA